MRIPNDKEASVDDLVLQREKQAGITEDRYRPRIQWPLDHITQKTLTRWLDTELANADFSTVINKTFNVNVIRYLQAVVFDFTASVATGDGKFYFHIPVDLDGMNLTEVHAEVITAGTTNTTDIQIANVTDSVDMLSTKLTIDSGETGSDTAATAAVINTANDDVATNDVIRIDVDQVSTTAPKGLIVTMGFQKP